MRRDMATILEVGIRDVKEDFQDKIVITDASMKKIN